MERSMMREEYEWHPNVFGYAVMLLFLVALWLCANVVLREITEYWRFWGFLFAVFTLITVPRIIEFLIKKYIDALSRR